MRLIVGLAVLSMSAALAGCGSQAESAPESPARLVPVQGTNLSQVILTEQAVQRIGLQTAPVQQLATGEAVPLASVIYFTDGSTWVYTVAGTRTYVRQKVAMAGVSGDMAVLQSGPPAGTQVVTTGAAELLGSEQGVAGGQ